MKVVVEMSPNGTWHPAGPELGPDDLPGSMSNTAAGSDQRDVYVFGWQDGDGPAVWHSRLGLDVELGSLRSITTLTLDKVADLTEGPFHFDRTMANGAVIPLRFRLES